MRFVVDSLALGQDFFFSFGSPTPNLISPAALHSLSIVPLGFIDCALTDLGVVHGLVPSDFDEFPPLFHLQCTEKQTLHATVSLAIWLVEDRLCGLVVRVLGYRSRGPGLIPSATTFFEK
jgi:hypothetical protein